MNSSVFSLINRDACWSPDSSVHFIHNWRSAGTTISSILSSNFPSQYLKIGHPFTEYGWPAAYNNHPDPLISLGQIRNRFVDSISSSKILGGHTFLGLESFLPGSFDIWMNYRDPLQRLNSGLIRFYKRTRTINRSKKDLMRYDGPVGDALLTSPHAVDQLLSTTLSRESNGISKRLAAFSLTPGVSFCNSSNVETPEFLSAIDYDSSLLYEAALANLNRIAIIINSQHIHASLICIERLYNLKSPLINPFSDLHHNPKTLSGSKSTDLTVIESCKDVLLKHSSVDIKLYSEINKRFAAQVNSSHIDTKEVAARQAFHSSPLLLIKWFNMPDKFSQEKVVDLAASSLALACKKYPELSTDIINLVFSWNVLTHEFRLKLQKVSFDKYSLSSDVEL